MGHLNFRRLQQCPDARHSRLKSLGIVCADYTLAGGQSQRFYNARKLDAWKNALQPLVETEREKPWHRETRIAQDFTLPEFAAAIREGLGRSVDETQSARGVSSGSSRAISQGDQSVHGPHQRLR